MAPQFSLLPVPSGGVPTNAAVIATQYYQWDIRVLDAGTEVPIEIDGLPQFGAGAGYVLVRPLHGWPSTKTLELIATQAGSPRNTARHAFRTASGPVTTAPRCLWKGPIAPAPRGPSIPEGMWPTNMPYRPHRNQRQFPTPAIESSVGYLVAAQLWIVDGGETLIASGAMAPGPAASIGLDPPGGRDDLSDAARIVAIELKDMAGNVARFGTVPTS